MGVRNRKTRIATEAQSKAKKKEDLCLTAVETPPQLLVAYLRIRVLLHSLSHLFSAFCSFM
jgi:hypothetical protein